MTSLSRQFSLRLALLVLGLAGPVLAKAQLLTGEVVDPQGTPIPFANLYFEELASGVATDDAGVFSMRLARGGDYRLIVSAIGYLTYSDTILVAPQGKTSLQLTLKPDVALLDEVVIKASKRDSAYAIMRQVVARRKAYLRNIGSYRAEVYVKAREDITKRIKKGKRDRISLDELDVPGRGGPPRPLGTDKEDERDSLATELNLLELKLRLNVNPPDGYKEERLARSVYGTDAGLFVPTFGDADFNFYRTRIDFGGLTKTPIISPLSPIAVIHYKFKLLDTRREDGQCVYEIAFQPRKRGNATATGRIVVNDGLFNLRSVDATLPRGAMRIFDELSLKQRYQEVADSLWLPVQQEFAYTTRLGQRERFRGVTSLAFSAFELNYTFPARYFNGEVAVTDALAYERDSTYWQEVRPEALAQDEARRVFEVDSITARLNSTVYKDSVEAAFNKVTPLEILWDGVGFRNHRRREQWYLGSVTSLLGFNIIGGWRIQPFATFFRRFESEQSLSVYAQTSYGLQREDVLGSGSARWRYDPKRLSELSVSGGRDFSSIFEGDGIRNQLSRSNYILADRFDLYHSTELLNGLYFTVGGEYTDRRPAPIDNSETFLSDALEDDLPVQFEAYQALVTRSELSFTPYQRYLSEPKRKVVLGSDWPTLTLTHQRGWNGLFSSDIDFDYLEASLTQRLELGAIGNTRYQAQVGRFVNTGDVRFVDIKRFRRSDPILFFEPLISFQSLDTSLASTRPFFELHTVHHFNGALVNNLPLVRDLRIEAVAGGGALWLNEGTGYRYEEVFVGLERIFKLGPRRRLRLGLFGVFSNSTARETRWEPKISFDIIDTWKRNWSF